MYIYHVLGILTALATATACYYRIKQVLSEPFEPFQPKAPIEIRIPYPEWLYIKGDHPDWTEFKKEEKTKPKTKTESKEVPKEDDKNISSLEPSSEKEFTGKVFTDRDGGKTFEWE